MAADVYVKSWAAFKASLVSENLLPSLFEECVDKRIAELSEGYPRISARARYEPLLLEQNLRAATETLDRVVKSRDTARELEIAAVKAAADYSLFLAQMRLERENELIELRERETELLREYSGKAAAEFHDVEGLGRGMAMNAMGAERQAASRAESNKKQRTNVEEIWKNKYAYEAAYNSRHQERGNAHNYAEQSAILFRLIAEDLHDLWGRLAAIDVGMSKIYGLNLDDIPNVDDQDCIDRVISWLRACIREREVLDQNETEYVLDVPLCQAMEEGEQPLVDPSEFDRRLKATRSNGLPLHLSFTLSEKIFFGDSRVRLRGVGLSYGNVAAILPQSGNDLNATFDSYARLRAAVATPVQNYPDGSSLRRPLIRFGNIGVFNQGRPEAYSAGAEVQNVSPLGMWEVKVYPGIVYKDRKWRPIAEGVDTNLEMKDLKLYLRVRTSISEAAGD